MNLKKLLFIFSNLQKIISGDTHECNLDTGHIWCDASNQCIQSWITPCHDLYIDCHDCLDKQRSGINIACPETCDIIQVPIPDIISISTDCKIVIPDCDNTYVCPKISICTSIEDHITYKLSLLINSNSNILNIYALFGDSQYNMIIPAAYQSPASSFGTNIGGIPDSIVKILPNSIYDSYLTIGITNGNIDNELSSVGIDFNEWNEENGLIISDGAVFSLQPNNINIINNEIMIGQITLQKDIITSMTINVRGKINNELNTWAENNIIFNLENTLNIQIDIPINCEIWFDGCNSCLVNNDIMNVCTELECTTNQEPRCLRLNNGH